MRLSIVAAVSENGVIGRRGGLPWHLSADLKRFKRLTMDHAIVMGRRTWESIGRPLPGRVSIVLTRRTDWRPEGALLAASLEEALAYVPRTDLEQDESFVIGGESLYRLALPRGTRIYLSRVHAEVDGDAVFPELDWSAWQLVEESFQDADGRNDYPHSFQIWDRREPVADIDTAAESPAPLIPPSQERTGE